MIGAVTYLKRRELAHHAILNWYRAGALWRGTEAHHGCLDVPLLVVLQKGRRERSVRRRALESRVRCPASPRRRRTGGRGEKARWLLRSVARKGGGGESAVIRLLRSYSMFLLLLCGFCACRTTSCGKSGKSTLLFSPLSCAQQHLSQRLAACSNSTATKKKRKRPGFCGHVHLLID